MSLYAHQAPALDRWTAVAYGRPRSGIGFALHRALEALSPQRPVPDAWSMGGHAPVGVEQVSVPVQFFPRFADHNDSRPLPSRTPSCGTPVSPQPSERVKSALTGPTS